jgi:hypothetical protein
MLGKSQGVFQLEYRAGKPPAAVIYQTLDH